MAPMQHVVRHGTVGCARRLRTALTFRRVAGPRFVRTARADSPACWSSCSTPDCSVAWCTKHQPRSHRRTLGMMLYCYCRPCSSASTGGILMWRRLRRYSPRWKIMWTLIPAPTCSLACVSCSACVALDAALIACDCRCCESRLLMQFVPHEPGGVRGHFATRLRGRAVQGRDSSHDHVCGGDGQQYACVQHMCRCWRPVPNPPQRAVVVRHQFGH